MRETARTPPAHAWQCNMTALASAEASDTVSPQFGAGTQPRLSAECQ
jgi:hypothetical protein